MKKKPILDFVQPYLDHGWTLIPLHKPFATSVYKKRTRKDGKRPLHKNWTKQEYKSSETVKKYGGVHNLGVALTKRQLVIDVDPRNGGEKGLADLCFDLGLETQEWPCVITGSGGFHFYFTKPEYPVLDSLPDYPGVEFKSKGRQVVAAGSLHPDTGGYYTWDDFAGTLANVPECPTSLFNLIRRPTQTRGTIGGGQHDQAEIAKFLEVLDPLEYREHDKWLELMMAVHHASAGDARSEFIDWSTSDPHYQNDSDIIGRRWDSLHIDRGGSQVTVRTLYKAMKDAGHPEMIPRTSAEDDFAGVDWDGDTGENDEDSSPGGHNPTFQQHPLEVLNQECCATLEGGKFRIFTQRFDPDMKRKRWVIIPRQDFENYYANHQLQRGDSVITLGKAWTEWAMRRTADGVVFDPNSTDKRYLNLWTGWGFEPKKGEWTRLQELIFEILANGKQDLYEYIINWCAFMVQSPHEPGGVALCMRGGRGVGKGTLGRTLVRLAGTHGLHISSSEHLTGRFNSHLQDVVMLFADEAVRPHDKQAESRLKALITEPTLVFEGKGRDSVARPNRMHVVMASNEEWMVPAAEDERRFAVFDANPKWVGKDQIWVALNKQLEEGGFAAFLFDLLKHPLEKDWTPAKSIPETEELTDQKIRQLNPVHQFWFSILFDARLPCEYHGGLFWSEEPVRLFKADIIEAFTRWSREMGIRRGSMGRSLDRHLLHDLGKVIPGGETIILSDLPESREMDSEFLRAVDNKAQAIQIPSLPECREALESFLKGKIQWPVGA